MGRPVRLPASPAHAEQRSKRRHRAQYRNARKLASVSCERLERDAGEEAATLASQHGVIAKNIASDRVTAADIIAFIEQTCFVPEGKFVGQRLKLAPFQKELIGAIYDNPAGTRRVIWEQYFIK